MSSATFIMTALRVMPDAQGRVPTNSFVGEWRVEMRPAPPPDQWREAFAYATSLPLGQDCVYVGITRAEPR